jgi:hypothetical protein
MAGEILASPTSMSSRSADDEECRDGDNNREINIGHNSKQSDEDHTQTNPVTRKAAVRTILYTMTGLVSVVVIAVSVYFAIRFISKRRNGLTAHKIIDDVITKSVYDKSTLLNVSSPQYRARQWMLFNDTVSVTLCKSSMVNSNSNVKQIAQRFAVAVIYFSMDLVPTNWMDTLSHECTRNQNGTSTWTGLNCNSENELVALWLGKLDTFSVKSKSIGLML